MINIIANVLAPIFLVYSLYALVFSLLVCTSLLLKRKNGAPSLLKTEVSLLMFFIFFMGVLCWLNNVISTGISLMSPIRLRETPSELCDALGFLMLFCEYSQNLGMFCLCFFTYFQICFHKNLLLQKIKFFLFILGLSVFLATVPFMYSGSGAFEGLHDLHCWPKDPFLILIIFYVPMLLLFPICIFMLISSLRQYKRESNRHTKELIKLFFFPFILFLGYSTAIVGSILSNTLSPQYDSKDPFVFVTFFMLSMHGILNPIYYFYLKPSLLKHLKRLIFKKESKEVRHFAINEDGQEAPLYMSIQNTMNESKAESDAHDFDGEFDEDFSENESNNADDEIVIPHTGSYERI